MVQVSRTSPRLSVTIPPNHHRMSTQECVTIRSHRGDIDSHKAQLDQLAEKPPELATSSAQGFVPPPRFSSLHSKGSSESSPIGSPAFERPFERDLSSSSQSPADWSSDSADTPYSSLPNSARPSPVVYTNFSYPWSSPKSVYGSRNNSTSSVNQTLEPEVSRFLVQQPKSKTNYEKNRPPIMPRLTSAGTFSSDQMAVSSSDTHVQSSGLRNEHQLLPLKSAHSFSSVDSADSRRSDSGKDKLFRLKMKKKPSMSALRNSMAQLFSSSGSSSSKRPVISAPLLMSSQESVLEHKGPMLNAGHSTAAQAMSSTPWAQGIEREGSDLQVSNLQEGRVAGLQLSVQDFSIKLAIAKKGVDNITPEVRAEFKQALKDNDTAKLVFFTESGSTGFRPSTLNRLKEALKAKDESQVKLLLGISQDRPLDPRFSKALSSALKKNDL